MTTKLETAEEFAGRIHETVVEYSASLIRARDEAVRAECLRPFVELAESLQRECLAHEVMHQGQGSHAYGRAAAELRALLAPKEGAS